MDTIGLVDVYDLRQQILEGQIPFLLWVFIILIFSFLHLSRAWNLYINLL